MFIPKRLNISVAFRPLIARDSFRRSIGVINYRRGMIAGNKDEKVILLVLRINNVPYFYQKNNISFIGE